MERCGLIDAVSFSGDFRFGTNHRKDTFHF